jgi:putative phosphoribosyl transferase
VFNFRNREQAGRQLSLELVGYSSANPIVLGIPRGGVPVAFEIARALNAPLDVFVTRKLGVPGHEELPFGAIAEGDTRYIDQDVARTARVSSGEAEIVIRAASAQVEHRANLYRNGESLPLLLDRTVILVDDGVATGLEIQAAVLSLRKRALWQLILAVPVISMPAFQVLRPMVDKLVTLQSAGTFYSVGQFYEKYPDLHDDEVISLLKISENFPHLQVEPNQLPPAA